MAIKAIETRYGGCRFRSRLEARWAVFLDRLDIPWEYEPQGFELPSGRYLPDFWLPEAKVWMEIKGQGPTRKELQKLAELAYEVSGENHRVRLLAGGIPRKLSHFALPDWGGGYLSGVPSMHPCPDPELYYTWVKDDPKDQRKISDYRKYPLENWVVVENLWIMADRADMERALTAARSARFEFGESG